MSKEPSRNFGYIRISDQSQKIDRQIESMKNLGIKDKFIYIDKQSGKNFNRPSYQKMIKALKSGDSLYIKELDRLGRNKEEIKNELKKFRDKKIHVRIMNIPTTMIDFGKNDWILDMVNNILVEVLAAVAEQERITIRQRQAEGIAIAKSKGVQFGRPCIALPDTFPYYYDLWANKEISRQDVLSILNLTSRQFSTYCRSYTNHLENEI